MRFAVFLFAFVVGCSPAEAPTLYRAPTLDPVVDGVLFYGMTARKYGNVDPRPVWRMMDDFGIDESRMQGYWLERPPVQTDHPNILATTFVREKQALISLASWSENDETVALSIDWEALGLDPDTAVISAPAVDGLQETAVVSPRAVQIPANQGLFVRISG